MVATVVQCRFKINLLSQEVPLLHNSLDIDISRNPQYGINHRKREYYLPQAQNKCALGIYFALFSYTLC